MNFVKTFEELTGQYKKETVIIYKDKNLVCMLPKSQKMSQIYGQNTYWCQQTKSGFDNWTQSKGLGLLIRFLFKNGRKIRFSYFTDNTYHWSNENGFHILHGEGNPFLAKSPKDNGRDMEKDVLNLIKEIPEECKVAVLKFIEENKQGFKYIYRKKDYLSKRRDEAIRVFNRCKKKYTLTFSNIVTDSNWNVYLGISNTISRNSKNPDDNISIQWRTPDTIKDGRDTVQETFPMNQYKEFEVRLAELVKELKLYIRQMNKMKKESVDFSGIYIDKSNIDGNGVFTKFDISNNTKVCEIADLSSKDDTDNWINDVGHNLNHSSYPNCKVSVDGNKCYLISIRDVKSGEELTTDYHNIPNFFDKRIDY